MMKFQLVQLEWDSCDGYDYHWSDFDCSHIPGAYRESFWRESRWHEEGYTIHQKAALNDTGEPYIKTWREDRKPPAKWFTVGRNHQQLEQYVWTCEIESGAIYIDIDTLDELLTFMKQYEATLDNDDKYPRISSYFKEVPIKNAPPNP